MIISMNELDQRMPAITVGIPVYKMKDWRFFLARCIGSVCRQSFTDYEIIISDASEDDEIFNFVNAVLRKLGTERPEQEIVCYHVWEKGAKMARNTNSVIRRASGGKIKILYMDDYLAHKDALAGIEREFKGGWLVTACDHDDGRSVGKTHIPYWCDGVPTGVNTIGSPSVLTIENKAPLFFNEEMTWVLDCEYYGRLHKRYGNPTIVYQKGVTIGVGDHQMTNILTKEEKEAEEALIKNI